MTLISKIKPEVLERLKESKIKYSSSYHAIILSLTNVNEYRELSIRELQNLTTFLPSEYQPKGDIDLYYGDYLLQKKYQL